MRCPSLAELPAPPPGRRGWPWTDESARITETIGTSPRITVITPSFNHGRFIEETVRSVLLQGYGDIEYFVLDGGSSDNTVEILKKYSPWLSFWVSEPDRGQSAAINRGFRMGSGLYATWINSDDMLAKNALGEQALKVGLDGRTVYLGDCININESGSILFTHRGRVNTLEDLVRIPSVWRSKGHISQPEVLFPLELALRVDGLNEDNHLTMDYELWGKFLLGGARFHYTGIPFGLFRWNRGQKTQNNLEQTASTLDVAVELIGRSDSFSSDLKMELLSDLQTYRERYPRESWKQSGRLARVGLPPAVVTPMRNLKEAFRRAITILRGSARDDRE